MVIEFTKISKSISDIYYLANTPSFIYNLMRQDQFVQSLSKNSTSDLIDTFNAKASVPIYSIEEMALMYAILVSLSFKPINEIRDFYRHIEETIKFEWFGEISKLYFKNFKPSPIVTNINIPTPVPNSNITFNTIQLSK